MSTQVRSFNENKISDHLKKSDTKLTKLKASSLNILNKLIYY